MKKILSLLLSLTVAFGTISLTASAGDTSKLPYEVIDELSQSASVLISKSDFLQAGKSGMISYVNVFDSMSYTVEGVPASENMMFDKAVKLFCHTPPSTWINAAVKVDFDKNSNAYKSIKKGDTLLLHYTVKGIEGECELSVRLWNSSHQDYNLINQGNRSKISSAWESHYFPMTVTDDTLIPNQLILKTNNTRQAMLISDFELINYGDKVTKEQLSKALKDAGATEIADKTCPYYVAEPQYNIVSGGDDGDDDDDENQEGGENPGTENAMITPDSFIESATLSGNGSKTKSQITSEESELYGLGFTDTLKILSNAAGSLNSLAISCSTAKNAVDSKNGDVVVLSFYARAAEKNTTIKASMVSETGAVVKNVKGENNDVAEYTYYIPTQWTKIMLPVTVGGNVGGIKLYMGSSASELEIGGVSLEKCEEGTDAFEMPAGYFLCEPYERLVIDYDFDNYIDRGAISGCSDIEICGEYVYAIGRGGFYVVSTETEKVIGSITGLGETRQLAISEDGNTAVVTSRVDGAFVISVDDKTKPQIVGRCDTVEYATGVCMANNYCYITNRMFGTEVIDLSDRTLPKNVANIRTGEAQSCEIVGTMLFAGCWGERRVEVWDVSDPCAPVLLNKNIPAHGKGDGLCVMDNYLYISTGHMDTYQATKGMYNVGYGLGNGMDIYDITDIKNPVFLSTVRIDDHFYTNGQDFWTVKVARKNDKIYAYLVNTFNGVYIYDVTKPEAPIRLAAIEVTVTKDKYPSKYTPLANSYGHNGGSKKSYFPYDTYQRQNSPIGGIAVADGKIYIGAVSTGIVGVSSEDIGDILYAENRELGTSAPESSDGNFYEIDLDALKNAGFTDIRYTLPGGQIYSVDEKDGLLYVAAGNQGIKILDSSLRTVKEYPTSGTSIVSEAVVHGTRLYTAEGLGGIAIYEISENGLGLTEISRYNPNTGIKFIRVSPNGKYVLCDSGSSHSELADFTDLKNPVRWNGEGAVNNGWNPHSGLMYFRQISTSLIGGRYLCSYGYEQQTYWYDFGEGDNAEPKLMYTISKANVGMRGGFTGLSGKNSKYALGAAEGKFFIFNPAECDATTAYTALPQYTVSGNNSGKTVRGKPTVCGDILLLNDRISGDCFVVDISGIDVEAGKFDAKYLTSFSFTGNPDIAKVIGDRIYYPLGNQGILSVSTDSISDNNEVTLSFKTARVNDSSADSRLGRATVKDSSGNVVAVFLEGKGNTHEFTAFLPNGSYTVEFEKNGYLTSKKEITVSGSTGVEAVTLIPGDIGDKDSVGDGKVNIFDVFKVLFGLAGNDSHLDVNEDGDVNVTDLMLTIHGMRMSQ